ncbi:hypothetical protein HJFPF1_11261 [Paramyrothecium foliicola]|nr:hypothetical protein HJFPF1_11261 [Paramyrothecium foliicola]
MRYQRSQEVLDPEAATERTPLLRQNEKPKTGSCLRPLRIASVLMILILALVLFCFLPPRTVSQWLPEPPAAMPGQPGPVTTYKGPRIHFPYNGTVKSKIPATDFPDPCILQAEDGVWYSFATNANGKHIQVAKAEDPLGEWELLGHDAMPYKAWTSGRNFWAPDVRRVGDGTYIMYYSGHRPQGKHCVGIARSRTVAGPYVPDDEPWECPLEIGGAIDPSGFEDPATGRRYVVYKVDGNAIGHGGSCNNMAEPQAATPIMLQEVDALDGSTKIGPPVAILDRTVDDGPLVEAPNLVRSARDGRYLLFFSSHCFTNPAYDVKFAWADAIEGPYYRGQGVTNGNDTAGEDGSLIRTGDFGLRGPGGMTSTVGRALHGEDEVMLLHGRCGWRRCMYALPYRVL